MSLMIFNEKEADLLFKKTLLEKEYFISLMF